MFKEKESPETNSMTFRRELRSAVLAFCGGREETIQFQLNFGHRYRPLDC
jgi:hypothetical protein